MKNTSAQLLPPRRRPKPRQGKRPAIAIDEASYSWIRKPGDRKVVREAIMRAVETKYEESTLHTVTVKSQVSTGHIKAVVVWRGSPTVSGDDMDYIREAGAIVDDVLLTHTKDHTSMTILVRETGPAPSVKSETNGYRPRKKARTAEPS